MGFLAWALSQKVSSDHSYRRKELQEGLIKWSKGREWEVGHLIKLKKFDVKSTVMSVCLESQNFRLRSYYKQKRA